MASGQDALLLWCKENTKGYKHVDINDFETSWMNGMALAALVDKFMPGKLVYATLSPSRAEKNIQLALDVAERNGIPAIIDPEDILHPDKADKATLITYLSQFYKKFSAPRRGHPISVVIGKESTICPKCEKPLSGTTVQALARNWHTECFKCTKCDKSLVGGQVMNIQKEPYCSACGKASFESKLKILPFGMGGPPAIKIAREEKAEKEDAKENSPPGKPNKIDNSTLRGRAQGPSGRRKPTRAADTAKTLKSKYAPPVYESLAVRTPNTKQHTRLSQLFNAPPATAAADYSIGSEDFAPSITKAQSQPVLSNVPAIASKSAEEISKPSTGGKISVDQFGPAPSPPTNSPPPVEALNLGPAPSPPTSPVPVVDIGNLGPAPLPPQPEPVEPAPIPDPSPLLSNDSAENNVATPPTVDKNNSCPVPLGDSVDKNEASDEEKENRPTSVSSKKPEELTPEEINLLLAEQERLREERKITNKSNWETSEREKIASYLQKKKEILAPVVVEEIIADPIGPTPIVNKKIAIPQESIKNWNNFKNEESQKKKESMHIEASKRSSEVEKQKMEEINLIKNRLAILDEFLEDGIVEHVVEYNWDDDMNVRIEGYLFKRDNVKSKLIQLQWRKRWFILQGSTFIYYHEEQHNILGRDRPPDGVINLYSIVSTEVVDAPNGVFKLHTTSDQPYVLKAEDPDSMHVWLKYISSAKKSLSNQKELLTTAPVGSKADAEQCGYLEKLGRFNKWSKRWFVLRDGVLFRYKTKGGEPMGKFPLFKAELTEYRPEKLDGRCFQLRDSKLTQTLILRASTVEEMHLWLNKILKQKVIIEETINSIIID